jgi:hypothetical protein
LLDPRAAYQAMIERFEAQRVYTPGLLRLQTHRANFERPAR